MVPFSQSHGAPRPHEATPGDTFIHHIHRSLLLALALTVASGSFPLSALAATTAQTLAVDRAALKEAVADRVAAQRRLDTVNRRAVSNAKELDQLLESQADAEDRLSSRARSIYRAGQASFVTVLLNAESFEGFTTRWALLTRISEQDAEAVRKVKASRRKAVRGARRLLATQEDASREMRELERIEAAARKKLGASQVAYAAYRQRVEATKSKTPAASPKKPTPATAKAPAKAKAKKKTSAPRVVGTGDWSTAVASHYGRNFRGRTADGSRIGPDSMIVAHKTLPFDTMVEFSFRGKTAVARVADRGPYTKGRSFDLGPGVIRILGFNGVHKVKYRVIGR